VPYSLRHSSIVRALLAGTPLQLVSSAHDTSLAIIQKHYARQARRHQRYGPAPRDADMSAPAASNVVPIVTGVSDRRPRSMKRWWGYQQPRAAVGYRPRSRAFCRSSAGGVLVELPPW
jgi:hypothetical protein